MKTGAVIQARMGSTRLSGKILINICGKTVLQHGIERLKQCKELDDIIIATTVLEQDEAVVKEAQRIGVKYSRGSEEDVLARYYYAAKENNLDVIVRITSDCPLIDPLITDEVIRFFKDSQYTLVTNAGNILSERTYPRGLDVEVFSFKALEHMFNVAKEKHQREHVTPFLYENDKSIGFFKDSVNNSRYRWTLDTDEDLLLIKTIYEHLYQGKHDFYYKDILELMNRYPEIAKINEHVEQKKLK